MSTRNLDGLFQPRSIVVVGPDTLGEAARSAFFANFARSDFKGRVTLAGITPPEGWTQGVVASLDAFEGAADLAVVMSGGRTAVDVVETLGKRGTKAVLFLSRGYDEWPFAIARRAMQIARQYDLRMVGPGSLGVMAPHAGLDLSLGYRPAKKGDLVLLSRSAAVINSTLAWAERHAVGFSAVVSLGQKVDVDVGDLLDHFTADYRTRAILVHLEQIWSPSKFLSAARAAARTKPVIVLRSGFSRDKQMIGATHSSRLAASDRVYDAAFRRAGLVRVESIDELFDAAETITRVKPTPCRRVAVVANGRSLATIAADHLQTAGGILVEIAESTVAALSTVARSGREAANPMTLPDDAPAEAFETAIKAMLADPGVETVIVLHSPSAFADTAAIARSVAAIAQDQAKRLGRKKPILTSFLDLSDEVDHILHVAGVPCHPTPEEAVRSFGHLVRYVAAQERLMTMPEPLPAEFVPDPEAARAIVRAAIAEGREWLGPVDVRALLQSYDIPVVPTTFAATPEEAVAVARVHFAEGHRVAVKIASRDIAFKSDVDGVRLGLADEAAVAATTRELIDRIGARFPDKTVDGVIVMPMIDRRFGIELLAGIADDFVFGPTVVFGRGGTAVEVIADRALDLVPLDMNLAHAMIAQTRVAKLLAGYRNRPPADEYAIALTLCKLSQLAADIPEIRELDLNPIVADHQGVITLDARVRLAPVTGRIGKIGHPRLAIRPYPKEWERETRLKDGREVLMRPIRPEDEALYADFFTEVTPEDLRLRFFAPIKDFNHAFLAKLTQLDYERAIAFAAIEKESGKLLGAVRLHADPDHVTGEYAILLRSNLKGQGLGWKLMRLMIEWAKADGITAVKGEILRENRVMIQMCEALGFKVKSSPDDESIAVVTLMIADLDPAMGV
ncbi:GNAT family N-acetyltransferase [Siculibacillus lacustris]|uniref:GNAT family N-acetyltransferase n=1 Tax=Siculibacillus lacustris TaxID=1549641 RepID=A0A4Q9VP11_9HYPH|nr:bifunctional acetate--CoA ligase family protein/GNAT family N-acetyltransferase [Siculibacillus lacustris]TBW37200.1 GNAT family N-acetyltransferase [Siculibacillus lacustris]